MKPIKNKYIYIAYSDSGREVFKTPKEAHQFAQARNLENDNWKSINTKWFVSIWPADQPITD